jgi:uncharacterized integral membrane protein
MNSMARDANHPPARRERRGTGLYPSLVLAFVLAIGILIAIIQNPQSVELKYFAWDLRTPLVVVLLVTVLATVMLSTLVGATWRHRRRGQLGDREELREMRQRAKEPVAEPAVSGPPSAQASPPTPPPGSPG